ncbi:MAG: ATP-binding protein [Chthoniobacteraceae bacterium]
MPARLDHAPDSSQLQGNSLFAGVPSELVNELGADMALLRFDPDDIIFNEGDPGDCLYLVVDGSVRISKLGRGGNQETLQFIQPGNFFGEMSLIDGEPRSAQASAAGPTVLGQVDAATFGRILENAPRTLHMNFLRSVVARLRGLNSHFITELMRNERLSLVGSMANSIVHDMKNPLTAIVSCNDLIDQRVPDASVAEFTSIMRRAADQLSDMVQELLDFARGQSSLQMQRHPARAVIQELQNQFINTLPAHIHLVLDIRFADDVNVDLGRFTRVLMNLAKNAIEAMPKGGILRIGLRQEGGRVVFKIGDTGCGIAPEMIDQVFEPFVTFGKSKGSGLGMSIAKSVAESHGGNIALTSKVGIGTTVEVALPALPVV